MTEGCAIGWKLFFWTPSREWPSKPIRNSGKKTTSEEQSKVKCEGKAVAKHLCAIISRLEESQKLERSWRLMTVSFPIGGALFLNSPRRVFVKLSRKKKSSRQERSMETQGELWGVNEAKMLAERVQQKCQSVGGEFFSKNYATDSSGRDWRLCEIIGWALAQSNHQWAVFGVSPEWCTGEMLFLADESGENMVRISLEEAEVFGAWKACGKLYSHGD